MDKHKLFYERVAERKEQAKAAKRAEENKEEENKDSQSFEIEE